MSKKSNHQIVSLIQKMLGEPTHEMQVAFGRLPIAHKWLLFALIELDAHGVLSQEVTQLQKRYDDLCPEQRHEPFEKVLDELSEAFVKKTWLWREEYCIEWIHPSCRDLTINELSRHMSYRRHFLKHCSIRGLELAISVGGGAKGERVMPLLVNEKDWALFAERSEILQKRGEDVLAYLTAIDRIIEGHDKVSEHAKSELLKCRYNLWPIFLANVENGPPRNAHRLAIFFQSRNACNQVGGTEFLNSVWLGWASDAEISLLASKPITDSISALNELSEGTETISEYEPRFFDDEINGRLNEIIDLVCKRGLAEKHVFYDWDAYSKSSLEEEKQNYDDLIEAFDRMSQFSVVSPEQLKNLKTAISHFKDVSNELDALADQKEEPKKIDEPVDAAHRRFNQYNDRELLSIFSDL